jgi:hypothetical protein
VHPRYALAALLHDASEAYLCDVPRPLKQTEAFGAYREAEQRLESVIYQAFGVDATELGAVCEADEVLLLTERRDLMAPGTWLIDMNRCLSKHIVPQTARNAEMAFLERFQELK